MSNRGKVIKLNANENFYGCAPEVLNSINHKITNVNLYPQHSGRLEEILAEKIFGITTKILLPAEDRSE